MTVAQGSMEVVNALLGTMVKEGRAVRDKCVEGSLGEAVANAEEWSGKSGLAQTVYRNKESCGWHHTHSMARLLQGSELAVTILPKNYFC